MNNLKKQFDIVNKSLSADSKVLDAFKEMLKLMEMFYNYLERRI